MHPHHPQGKKKRPLARPEQRERIRMAVQQRIFLRTLRQKGVIGPSGRAAGVSPAKVKRWLDTDPSFVRRYVEARQAFRDLLLERLYDRAFSGDAPTLRVLARYLLKEERSTSRPQGKRDDPHAHGDAWAAAEQALAHLNN